MIAEALACGLALIQAVNLTAKNLEDLIAVESGGNPIALNVNHLGRAVIAADADDAARLAHRYIDAGYSVDIGLMQINNRHLAALGLTVEQALDLCSSVRGGATIFATDYQAAMTRFGAGPEALGAALSAYNTGNWTAGFANGYVAKYSNVSRFAPRKDTNRHETPRNAILDPYTADGTIIQRTTFGFRVE
jgi:type IV secretion system protein VirB1